MEYIEIEPQAMKLAYFMSAHKEKKQIRRQNDLLEKIKEFIRSINSRAFHETAQRGTESDTEAIGTVSETTSAETRSTGMPEIEPEDEIMLKAEAREDTLFLEFLDLIVRHKDKEKPNVISKIPDLFRALCHVDYVHPSVLAKFLELNAGDTFAADMARKNLILHIETMAAKKEREQQDTQKQDGRTS